MNKKILSGQNKEKVALEYSDLTEEEFNTIKKTLGDVDFIIAKAGATNVQLLATAFRENPNILNNLPKIVNSLKGMGLG